MAAITRTPRQVDKFLIQPRSVTINQPSPEKQGDKLETEGVSLSIPTSKQLDRASKIVAAAENLQAGLLALQGIAFQMSQDGVTLTDADLTNSSLSYTTGSALDQMVSASMALAEAAGQTIPGSSPPVTFAQAIAAVCGS